MLQKINFVSGNNKILAGLAYITALLFLFFVFSFTAQTASAKTEITDQQVSDAVEDELFLDHGVQSDQIDVTTIDGIVTLRGEVSNLLAKERAARIALIVKGVRSVINEIQVDPPLLFGDREIENEVRDALILDPATESYEVDVDVDNRKVVLTGTVQSWKEKELCEKVAKGVKGAVAVDNRIKVNIPEKRDDYEIKKEIERTLRWDAYVDHALIDVEVNDGKVSLSGTVGSAAEKETATADSYVNGVKDVDNSKLEVSMWERNRDLKGNKYANKTDVEIETAIKDALMYDPRVFSFEINVDVNPATKIATLRGTVNNLKAKNAAAGDARNTAGVWKVDNRIKVRPDSKLSDKKIRDRIKDALSRNPFLESYDISVKVANGIADLYGTVDTFFEKSEAQDVVSKVKGVILVDNNLLVQDLSDKIIFDPWVDRYYLYDYDWDYNTKRFPVKSDTEILMDIQDEMFWSPFVDADQVDVEVDQGVATLTGKVDSWIEYNSASENAYEGGAVYVNNELKVE